jgi:hypothetical protein
MVTNRKLKKKTPHGSGKSKGSGEMKITNPYPNPYPNPEGNETHGDEFVQDQLTDLLLKVYWTRGPKETKRLLRMALANFAAEIPKGFKREGDILEELSLAIITPAYMQEND